MPPLKPLKITSVQRNTNGYKRSNIEKGVVQPVSKIRKKYVLQLIIRCIVWVLCCCLCIFRPEEFEILEGANFFSRFSVLHLLWAAWMFDMVLQIIPMKNNISLGSQKLFVNRFKPIREKIDYEALRNYIRTTTKAAYKVMLLWVALIAAIGILYWTGFFRKIDLFMITVCFYVFDLICVLIWCPFRLLMRTRCCTTCRIFNWDHFMMFSPIIFVGGIYAVSLVVMSLLAWVVWELYIMMYPERFWDKSNAALKCSECTDKLCTQYCQKLRKEQAETPHTK